MGFLFSDGRQKAARLARDIPREVLADTFRQVLVIASQKLTSVGIEPRPNLDLYIAFLAVVSDHSLSLFDGDDYLHLEQQVRQFNDNDDLEDAIVNKIDHIVVPKGVFDIAKRALRPSYPL